jgi:hypothetical protein
LDWFLTLCFCWQVFVRAACLISSCLAHVRCRDPQVCCVLWF